MPPDTTETTYTDPFHDACINNDLPQVQKALTSGNLSPESLSTGLKFATLEGHPEIVAALFDAGIRMTPDNISSLCGRKRYQNPRVIRLYINRGLRSKKFTTLRGEPLLRFLNAACARELLEHSVDPNRCGPKKIPPLVSALKCAHADNGALFDLLIEYGAKMESNLFFSAIVWSRANTAFKTRFLLAKGLDPNTTSAEWGTPLHCAVHFAEEEVVQILLDAGADPTARAECKQFGERDPAELAELQHDVRQPCMQGSYKSILQLLVDAQAGRTISKPNRHQA